MMWSLPAIRALTRVELRQFRRNSRRALLIAVLIATAVAALVGASALAHQVEPTDAEQVVRTMGRASLRIDGLDHFKDRQAVLAFLPDATQTADVFVGQEQVSVPGRRLSAQLYAVDHATIEDGGLAAGILKIVEGRAPRNAGEVALSPALLAGLGQTVGGAVTLSYGTSRLITGAVVDPEHLDAAVILRQPAIVELGGTRQTFIGLNDEKVPSVLAALRERGYRVTTRDEAATADGGLADIVFALGGIGLFEAALVIAATVGATLRRRQFEFGLLAATGAAPRLVVAALLTSTGGIGLIGSVSGALIGLLCAAALHPWLDVWNQRLNGAFEIPWPHMLGAILLGTLVAVLAAVIPARQAAYMPIRVALSAKRPSREPSSSWLILGLACLFAGVALLTLLPRDNTIASAVAIVGGPILGLAGFGACSPWLLDLLAKYAAGLPLAWRLAVRDAGRFRARNGPVVTAVLAGMAMSVTMAILVAGVEAAIDAFPPSYRDDQLLVEGPQSEAVARRLKQELPVIAMAPLAAVYAHNEPVRARFDSPPNDYRQKEWVACGDEALLRALGVEAASSDFNAGDVIAINARDASGALRLSTWLGNVALPSLDVCNIATTQNVAEPRFVLWGERLAALGYREGPPLNRSLTPWLLRLDRSVTADDLQIAQRVASSHAQTTIDAQRLKRQPARSFYYLALALCMVTGLIIVLIATALSAAESADDRRKLHEIGAAPRLLRKHQAAYAGYLALLGCALAVPAGILPAASLLSASNLALPFVVPWRDLVVIVVALPTIAYCVGWLVGGRAPTDRKALVAP